MPTPAEMAATMLLNVPDKTGKTILAWHKILSKTSFDKHGQLVKYLKKDHGVTHGFANLIVTKYLSPDTSSESELVTKQYAGAKLDLMPIYEALISAVQTFGEDVELAPKKAYVSLRRKKQFALIQPSTKTRVDVGLNLKDVNETKRLERSGSFNAMVSHRVKLSSVKDVNKQLIAWLRDAYEKAG